MQLEVVEFSTDVTMRTGGIGSIAFDRAGVLRYERFGRVGRMTASGSFDELTRDENPKLSVQTLLLGPGGNMWFTECGIRGNGFASAVGYFTPEGHVAEFFDNSITEGMIKCIVVGPDGNLWYGKQGSLGGLRLKAS